MLGIKIQPVNCCWCSLLESQHDLQQKVEERQQRIAQLEKIIEGKEHGVQNMCQQVNCSLNLTSCIMHVH